MTVRIRSVTVLDYYIAFLRSGIASAIGIEGKRDIAIAYSDDLATIIPCLLIRWVEILRHGDIADNKEIPYAGIVLVIIADIASVCRIHARDPHRGRR